MLPSISVLGAILGLSELALAILKRSRSGDSNADSGSLRILWIVILCSIGAAMSVATGTANSHALYVSGLAIFLFGAVLRWYSVFYLGRFFTVDVHVAADHRIVNTGPYRWIRHPSYTGLLLEFLGFGMCLGGPLSVLVLMLPTTAAFLYRIRVEESALEQVLSGEYSAYRARTRKLIPFVY